MQTTKQAVALQPYLFFNGRCEEALEFYQQALGAEVTQKMRFSEMPEGPECGPPMSAEWKNKIMHSSLKIGEAVFMASDGCEADATRFQSFSLALSVPDKATCEKFFQALAAEGQVDMPLVQTFWSPLYGMLTDRFGVKWMVMVAA